MYREYDWVQDKIIRPLIASGPVTVESFFAATFGEGDVSEDYGPLASITFSQEPKRPALAERPYSEYLQLTLGVRCDVGWDFASELELAIPAVAGLAPEQMVAQIDLIAGGLRLDRLEPEQQRVANWLAGRAVRVIEEDGGDVVMVPVSTMLSMVPRGLLEHHETRVCVTLHPAAAHLAERIRLVGRRFTVRDKSRLGELRRPVEFLGVQHQYRGECAVTPEGVIDSPGNFSHPVFLMYLCGLDESRLRGVRFEVAPHKLESKGGYNNAEFVEVGAWSAAELAEHRRAIGFDVPDTIVVPLGAGFARGGAAVFGNESLNMSGVEHARLVVDSDERGAEARVYAVHYMPFLIMDGMLGMRFSG